MLKIRYAKVFTGTKKNPDYEVYLQYLGEDGVWKNVEGQNPNNTPWASKEDEEKYDKALTYVNEYR